MAASVTTQTFYFHVHVTIRQVKIIGPVSEGYRDITCILMFGWYAVEQRLSLEKDNQTGEEIGHMNWAFNFCS